jgi:DNA-binding MarR family transcriptional regulator
MPGPQAPTRSPRRSAAAAAAPPSPDHLEVASRLRPLLLHLARQLRRETHALGLTGSQASLLASVHGTPGIGVNELAQREGMAAPTVSVHIDRLEAMGLVERVRASSGDRRRVGLQVTRTGVRALLDVRRRRTAWLARRLAQLQPEELARIDAAIDALARISEVPS